MPLNFTFPISLRKSHEGQTHRRIFRYPCASGKSHPYIGRKLGSQLMEPQRGEQAQNSFGHNRSCLDPGEARLLLDFRGGIDSSPKPIQITLGFIFQKLETANPELPEFLCTQDWGLDQNGPKAGFHGHIQNLYS